MQDTSAVAYQPAMTQGAVGANRADTPIAAMRGVEKTFGDVMAVKNLTFAIPQGALVGLIGPSGCGKTTAVRLMLGIYEPSAGDCQIFGHSSHRMDRATRARLGYLPQQFVLYPTLTVEENLNFAASLYGLGPYRRRSHKSRVLELVGLTEHRHKLAAKLSGGMQRRLALAATLLHQPDLILLDEPTAGIDPLLREHLWQEFRNLQASGRTQIVTTQYVGEAEYCDSVILMDRGEIIAYDTPDALRRLASDGELIELTSDDLDRSTLQRLRALPGVRALRLNSEGVLRLTVEGASEVMPAIISTVQDGGGTVRSIEERRMSFNEVFISLLARSGRQTPTGDNRLLTSDD